MAPRPRGDLFYQEVSDGGVLYDAEGQKVFVLNASAAFVWNSCDGRRTPAEIAADLGESLGAGAPGPEQLLRDVEKSLADFRLHGLLEGA